MHPNGRSSIDGCHRSKPPSRLVAPPTAAALSIEWLWLAADRDGHCNCRISKCYIHVLHDNGRSSRNVKTLTFSILWPHRSYWFWPGRSGFHLRWTFENWVCPFWCDFTRFTSRFFLFGTIWHSVTANDAPLVSALPMKCWVVSFALAPADDKPYCENINDAAQLLSSFDYWMVCKMVVNLCMCAVCVWCLRCECVSVRILECECVLVCVYASDKVKWHGVCTFDIRMDDSASEKKIV